MRLERWALDKVSRSRPGGDQHGAEVSFRISDHAKQTHYTFKPPGLETNPNDC